MLCCRHETVISVINICNHFHCIEFILLFCFVCVCNMHCFSCDNDFQLSRYNFFFVHSVSLQTKRIDTKKNLATKKTMTINKTPFFVQTFESEDARFTFSLSWRVSAKKRTTFGYRSISDSIILLHSIFFYIFYFAHTNTLIKKSLFACDVMFLIQHLFLCAWIYVLQLVSCTLSLLLLFRSFFLFLFWITGLSFNAVLKSIFNSIQRVTFENKNCS